MTKPHLITPQQIALHQFTSKSPIREVLACVYTDGHRAVATDSFRLVEVTSTNAPADKPLLIQGASLKAAKVKRPALIERTQNLLLLNAPDSPSTSTVLTEPDAGTTPDDFPKYEGIFPTGDSIEITVNGQYLADIAAYLAKFDPHQKITMRVYQTMKPLVFVAETREHKARAMLMPCSN